MSIPRLLLLTCLSLAAACTQEAATDADAGHAHGAAPGSQADWCAEHSVPESKCTRCDASLIAAFKATGDWCPEHALPESQCVACDPSRKLEPPTEGAK